MDDKPFKLSPTFSKDLAAGLKKFDEAEKIAKIQAAKALLEDRGVTTIPKENPGIFLVLPNADHKIGDFVYCKAEETILAHIKSIGRTVEFDGVFRKIVSVRVTEEEIIIEFDK